MNDILLWLECYTTMASLLVSRYPGKATELWAYQHTILCAQRDFDGDAWLTYDTCYRRQAAARKCLDWSQVDFNLYNQTFAGRAKAKNRCKLCLSEYHRTTECYYAPDPPPAPVPWQRDLPIPRRSSDELPPRIPRAQTQTESAEICRLFNSERGNMCRYSKCRYAHVCMNKGCHGRHPASEYTMRSGLGKRPRSPPPPRRSPRQP